MGVVIRERKKQPSLDWGVKRSESLSNPYFDDRPNHLFRSASLGLDVGAVIVVHGVMQTVYYP